MTSTGSNGGAVVAHTRGNVIRIAILKTSARLFSETRVTGLGSVDLGQLLAVLHATAPLAIARRPYVRAACGTWSSFVRESVSRRLGGCVRG
jgi:hypothetical protein